MAAPMRQDVSLLSTSGSQKNPLGNVKIAPGAVVCVESEIKGDVTIGPRTVVHPKARIYAEAGPIIIGEGNLIEEQAFIRNSFPENIAPDSDVEPKTMIIGTNNVFEVGCCILQINNTKILASSITKT
ncbi:hypothetical protein XENTR_v10001074 [Xenopus tropicalis]|nr:hypothetical protein XENTR_v10001074 [Xenopus tropicalis]